MNAGRQICQVGFVDVQLIRDGQQKQLWSVLAEAVQMLLQALAPTKTEHFQHNSLARRLVDQAEIRQFILVSKRKDLRFLREVPLVDPLAEQLGEHAKLWRYVHAGIGLLRAESITGGEHKLLRFALGPPATSGRQFEIAALKYRRQKRGPIAVHIFAWRQTN